MIDVSKCKHLWSNNNNECVAHQDNCDNISDCYYKQLQQLKQENEKLRQVRKDNPDIQEPYVLLYRQLKKENNELKQENEEFKNDIEQVTNASNYYFLKLKKIREYCTKYGQNSIGFRKNILQIIEEE